MVRSGVPDCPMDDGMLERPGVIGTFWHTDLTGDGVWTVTLPLKVIVLLFAVVEEEPIVVCALVSGLAAA